MRIGIAAARSIGSASRGARRARRPCVGGSRTPSNGSPTSGARISSRGERAFSESVTFRSQLGAIAVVPTHLRMGASGASSLDLEIEGDGEDDDGT